MKPAAPRHGHGLPPFVDLETAARLANVTRRTVQNKLASREIPRKAVKMEGRHKVVAVAALSAVFGPLQPLADASPSRHENGGEVLGNFHELPAELADLRAMAAAKDAIIANLQTTLDHERKDREHERENWRKTLERTQANLLAAQDTPTARALAGASLPDSVIDVVSEPAAPATGREEPTTPKSEPARRPWWRSLFTL